MRRFFVFLICFGFAYAAQAKTIELFNDVVCESGEAQFIRLNYFLAFTECSMEKRGDAICLPMFERAKRIYEKTCSQATGKAKLIAEEIGPRGATILKLKLKDGKTVWGWQ